MVLHHYGYYMNIDILDGMVTEDMFVPYIIIAVMLHWLQKLLVLVAAMVE